MDSQAIHLIYLLSIICSASSSSFPVLKFTEQPTSKTVNPGESVTLNCKATGRTTITYSWYNHDVDFTVPPSESDLIDGATGEEHVVESGDVDDSTDKKIFQCKATGEGDVILSDTAIVKMQPTGVSAVALGGGIGGGFIFIIIVVVVVFFLVKAYRNKQTEGSTPKLETPTEYEAGLEVIVNPGTAEHVYDYMDFKPHPEGELDTGAYSDVTLPTDTVHLYSDVTITAPVPAGGATSYENVKISKDCKSKTASTVEYVAMGPVEYVAMGRVLPKSQKDPVLYLNRKPTAKIEELKTVYISPDRTL